MNSKYELLVHNVYIIFLHITIMKKENNTLIIFSIFIIIVLVIQSSIIIYFFNKISILEKQDISNNDKSSNITDFLNKKIDESNSELLNKINNLENDINLKVGKIEAKSNSDFSNIIEASKNSVVTIKTDISQGTGFIITNDGYVVTNAHVLEGAHYAKALTNDQQTKNMTLVGYNKTMDLALLKIEGSYDYLEFDDSDNAKVGEKVIAIGNPLGLSFSVSEGIISALNRQGNNGLYDYIQTDASLNPGNSGGPLINSNGKVIGINNFKANAENIGFSLESNYIIETINQISFNKLNETLIY